MIGKSQSKTSPQTPANLDDIPPMLDRRGNGADVQALLARIAQLEAQVARKNSITLKVTEKGAVSAYGMGRFPVTLYGEQWKRLLDMKETILAFIEANADKLSTK